MASGHSIIAVDTNGLRDLATAADRIRAALSDDHGVFGGRGCGIEHRRLQHALDDFDNRWSDKRKKIDENLKTMASSINNIAGTFDDSDQMLADALASDQASTASASGAVPVGGGEG